MFIASVNRFLFALEKIIIPFSMVGTFVWFSNGSLSFRNNTLYFCSNYVNLWDLFFEQPSLNS